jgi:hypothetical protein
VGTARSRRWHRSGCNDGEQRREAVRADGSAVGKARKAQRGRVSGGEVQE